MPSWKSVLAVPVLFLALGCGGKTDQTKSATVKGKVTLDGAPMPTGKITFDEGPTVPAVELDIKDGAYSGSVSVGKKTIRFALMKDSKPIPGMPGMTNQENALPAKYHSASTEVREVKDGADNTFDFTISTKK